MKRAIAIGKMGVFFLVVGDYNDVMFQTVFLATKSVLQSYLGCSQKTAFRNMLTVASWCNMEFQF
jgi:hypothetical protein